MTLDRTRQFQLTTRATLVALVALSLIAPACDRGESTSTKSRSKDEENDRLRVNPPPDPPEHRIAAGLREKYPDVTTFVDEFLAACLVGDYAKYRQYVSRSRNPESRERFAAIYGAIKSVQVESIDPIDPNELKLLPKPAFLVTSAIDLKPDKRPAAGGINRKIAIIVFQEQNEWRMIPAPSQFQPHDDRAASPTTTSAPAADLPEYPWEDAGDG